jgi:hypothetical protein
LRVAIYLESRYPSLAMSTVPPTLAQRQRVLNIIWTVMAAGIPIYWLAYRLAGPRAASAAAAVFAQVLTVLAVLTYAAAIGWCRWTMAAVERQLAPIALAQLTSAERTGLQDRLQNALVVCLALLEAPVAYGLSAAFAGASVRLFEVLSMVSLGLMVGIRLGFFPKAFQCMERFEAGRPGVA